MATPTDEARTRYHHGALRPALVEAGLTLLDQRGVEAVGLREVARACGVSHTAPLRHVADRRALLTLIATACSRHMHNHLTAQVAEAGCLALREAGVAYVDYALRWPERFRLMWRTDLLHVDDEDYRQAMGALWGVVTRELEALVGAPLPPDAEQRFLLAMATVHGLARLSVDGGLAVLGARSITTPETTRLVLNLLGQALRAPPLTG